MPKDKAYLRLGFQILAEFGAGIAIPAVIFSLLGKWLDKELSTEPYLLIASFVIAFLLSALFILKQTKKFAEQYRKLNADKNAEVKK